MTDLTRLYKRQKGLEKQIRITGKEVLVYDYEEHRLLESLKSPKFNPDELVYCYYKDAKFSFLKNNYIVSAKFPSGVFWYSCMGVKDSDREYVAIRSTYKQIDRLSELLLKKGAESIMYGREVNQKKLIEFLNESNKRSEDELVQEFFELPIELQEIELRNIFASYEGGRS